MVCFSDRATPPRGAQTDPGGVGIDRLALAFPLRSAPRDDGWSSEQLRRDSGGSVTGRTLGRSIPLGVRREEGKRATATASAFVGASLVNGEWWGKVEVNPSRMGDPEGCSLVHVRSWERVADDVWSIATDVLDPDCPVDSARIKRVDLARDFRGLRNPGMYVRGLMNVRRPYARRVGLWASPAHGNAETLHAGSGAGMVRLYDQHEAYASKGAPEGSLRWEVEARGEWVSKVAHSDRVGRVTAGHLVALADARWEWSGMGTEVRGTCDVVEVVERDTCRCRRARGERRERVVVTREGVETPVCAGCLRAYTPAVADRLLGMLLREAHGLARPASKDTAAHYGALKRRLGMVPTADLFAGAATVPIAGRLDYTTGREVVAA